MRPKLKFKTPAEARRETEQYLTAGLNDPSVPGWPPKRACRVRAARAVLALLAGAASGPGVPEQPDPPPGSAPGPSSPSGAPWLWG